MTKDPNGRESAGKMYSIGDDLGTPMNERARSDVEICLACCQGTERATSLASLHSLDNLGAFVKFAPSREFSPPSPYTRALL